MSRRQTLVGLGIGLAAAGATTAVGIAADRLARARRTALALDSAESEEDGYDDPADEELVVMADDGVVLHVEVDHSTRGPDDLAERAFAPTVVFSHGYCLSLRSWVFQRRALRQAGYRQVLWDQRGHGRSGSGVKDSYHIDQLGRDLARVLAEVVPEGPIVLIGHSMGGMTQMALAVDHHELIRDRVVGVAFIATSPGGLSTVSWGLGTVLGRFVKKVGPAAVGTLASRQGLVDTAVRAGRDIQQFFVDRYSFASPVPMSVVRLAAEMIFATRMEVISSFMPTFDMHDKREALEQFVGVETLVMNGEEDQLTPPEHSDEIVRLIPGAEHVVVAEAGHLIMLEHPDVVTEQLLGLIRRGTRAATAGGPVARPRTRRTLTDLAKRRRDHAASVKPAKAARGSRPSRGRAS
ncbi:MAG TPA: alpha/beta hydrolase [Dermatophilaceae bacterium]|nr:alpha/beta hydrolase [Dermatophilaceae bacterium]